MDYQDAICACNGHPISSLLLLPELKTGSVICTKSTDHLLSWAPEQKVITPATLNSQGKVGQATNEIPYLDLDYTFGSLFTPAAV